MTEPRHLLSGDRQPEDDHDVVRDHDDHDQLNAPSARPQHAAWEAATPARETSTHQAPLVVARGLTLRARHRRAFGPIDLEIGVGTLHLLVGATGSGRSSALLALTGRLSGISGELTVNGIDAIARAGEVRAITSVARVGDLVVPEPMLTVAESLTERCLLDGVPTAQGEMAFTRAVDLLGLTVDRGLEVERLTALDQLLLAVGLACVRPTSMIVVDDLEDGLMATDVDHAVGALSALAASGPSVVAGALGTPNPSVPATHLAEES